MREHTTPGLYAIGPHLIALEEGQVVAYPDDYVRETWNGPDWREEPIMRGSQVTYDGKKWESRVDHNMKKPGEKEWSLI